MDKLFSLSKRSKERMVQTMAQTVKPMQVNPTNKDS